MPVTTIAEASREIDRLSALAKAQNDINVRQSALIADQEKRIAVLEAKLATLEATAGGAKHLERLAAAANQFGAFFADLLPNHSTAPNTTRPWKPV